MDGIEKYAPNVGDEALDILFSVGRASAHVSALYHAYGGISRPLAKALKHLDRAYEALAEIAKKEPVR